MKKVPLIITMDLETAHDYDLESQGNVLEKLFNDLHSLGIVATVFVTTEFLLRFPLHVKSIYGKGNELGCHGVNHSLQENYKIISDREIRNNLQIAGDRIENLTGKPPSCFRGPGMTTSSLTQKALIDNGYIADFSVCSGRMDFFNPKGGDIRWLTAPRKPYKPSEFNPYKRGNLSIWSVPLSCAGFPFMSGIMYLFGLKFMKNFFVYLLKESLRNQKPIVYLFHSYEFADYKGRAFDKDSANNAAYKRPALHRLYIKNPDERYNLNLNLIKYMIASEMCCSLSGSNYVERLIS